jgi:hypothetical protein
MISPSNHVVYDWKYLYDWDDVCHASHCLFSWDGDYGSQGGIG